jgi:hypothetical protein
VVDHLGHPVAGARVLITTHQNPELKDGVPGRTFRGSSTKTDDIGRFVLRGVGRLPPKLLVLSPDALQICLITVQPGQEEQITLPKSATLRVRYNI